MMNKTREIVYLASLLHDIGKFYQRADNSYKDSGNLRRFPYVVKNADNICPTSQEGYFKYQHVIWTQLFFEENKSVFQKLGLYEDSSFDNLINLSIYHHKPSSKLQAFIQYADWWASGMERTEYESDEEKIKRGKLKFKQEPLINIFCNLKVNGSDQSEKTAYKLNELSLSKELFSTRQNYIDGVSQKQYADLWSLFSEEFKHLPTDSVQVFSTSLHYLLKKYCWCIPASTIDLSDNSLFDHLKVTAAIAHSLVDFDTEYPEAFDYNKRITLRNGHYPLLLLCVDISGIQKFIYDISSKYAAKSLKGRSFSLQLMLDEIAQEIVRKTETTLSHIVYSSGGKFFMLLPNTSKTITTLEGIDREIRLASWEKYKGNIYACMGYESFAYDLKQKKIVFGDGTSDTLGTLWKRVSEKTAEKKHRKFMDLLIEDYDKFFNGCDTGGLAGICSVTGEETKLTYIDEEIKISPQVIEQKEIGESLTNHDFIIYSNTPQPNHKSTKFDLLIGRNFWITDKNGLLPVENAEICLTVKNHIDFLNPVSAKNTPFSYRFYGGSESAIDNEGELLTFEQLAESGSFNRLGVLRMDVDSLGKLFIQGFNRENASFSAYATLSGQLDWFFSGYLNTIRNQPGYQDRVNIIYSGGDDVFAVGRWDAIIDFANDVQQNFQSFTTRKDITLSAGIAIFPPKYPIAKAADLAGEAEDAAKNFVRPDGKEKNALTLFGITVGWEEFEIIKVVKNFWLKNLSGERPTLSRGILQKMFDYYAIYDEREEKDPTKRKSNLSWRWNAAYALKRQESKQNIVKTEALRITERMLLCHQFEDEHIRFEALIVACRWAELELRDNK